MLIQYIGEEPTQIPFDEDGNELPNGEKTEILPGEQVDIPRWYAQRLVRGSNVRWKRLN